MTDRYPDVIKQLAESHGFEPVETGGGCTALRKDLVTSDRYWLITDEGDCAIPTRPDEPVLIGFYEDGNDPIDVCQPVPSLLAALAVAADEVCDACRAGGPNTQCGCRR